MSSAAHAPLSLCITNFRRAAFDPGRVRLSTEVVGRRRANLLIGPAQTLFPQLDDSRRKFTRADPSPSTGFRPHLKQEVIFAEVALGNLISFRARPSLGCHVQELDERNDILVVAVHDIPPL